MIDNTYTTIYDLLYSVTTFENKELSEYIINQLKLSNDLDIDERQALNEFISLTNEIKRIPSSGVLVSKNIAYSNAKTISQSSIEDILSIFISNKRRMKLSTALSNLAMSTINDKVSYDDVLNKINDLVGSSDIATDNDYTTLLDIDSKLQELNDKEEVKGIPFGIDFIDEIYPGTTPKSFTVLAGFTGSMKTTLAANHCMINMQLGKNVLYLSLEVSEEDLIYSMMSNYSMSNTNEPIKRDGIKKLKYNDKAKFSKLFKDTFNQEGKLVIYDEKMIERSSQARYNEIIHKIDKDMKEKTGHGLDLIILDHAQLLKYDEESKNKDPYQVLNRWTEFFRKVAVKEGIAVILLSQTSRGGYEYACKHGGQYLLTGLAEGNELERGATCVMTLFSNDELKASGQIQVQLLKNRFGPTMLEPQTVNIRPEYFMIGDGFRTQAKQVDVVFNNEDTPFNPFTTETSNNLDNILGGM